MARFGRPGLLGTVTRTAVITGTPQATSTAIPRRATWSDAAAEPTTASRHPDGPDLVIALQQLADLHAAGALTRQQFEAAKVRVLGV